jgi:2-aminobenzoate-CoA ligase
VFPLRFGATATLLENASPPNMIEIIQKYKATVCFTAPTAYRAMLTAMEQGRICHPARGRFGRRDPARAGLSGMDGQDGQAHAGRDRRDRVAAYLHQQPL